MSYYTLSPNKQLCGYDGLPFALFDTRGKNTEFFNRGQFELLLLCDGNNDIDMESLPQESRSFFE